MIKFSFKDLVVTAVTVGTLAGAFGWGGYKLYDRAVTPQYDLETACLKAVPGRISHKQDKNGVDEWRVQHSACGDVEYITVDTSLDKLGPYKDEMIDAIFRRVGDEGKWKRVVPTPLSLQRLNEEHRRIVKKYAEIFE